MPSTNHQPGCTFGWDGSCVVTCPHSPSYNPDMIEHGVDCQCAMCLAEVAEYNKKLARRKGKKRVVREDDVEGKYIEAREAEGALVLKVKVLGRPGYPDRWVLNGSAPLVEWLVERCGYKTDDAELIAEDLLARCFSMAELKKQANSRFQPKQKQIIPMLRKRGFKVDVVHG